MGTVRAELAFPLENRGGRRGAVARGVEEVALALGIAHLLDRPHRRALGRRAAARRARRRAGRPPAAACCSTSRRRSSTRSPATSCIWLLRRLNEEWGTAVVLAEHRLERCLAAADRVVALRDGAVACDARAGRRSWPGPSSTRRRSQTPARARCSPLAGLRPLPVGVKEARAALRGARAAAGAPRRRPHALAAAPGGAARRRDAALRLDGVWHELRGGPALLRGVDLARRARASASR